MVHNVWLAAVQIEIVNFPILKSFMEINFFLSFCTLLVSWRIFQQRRRVLQFYGANFKMKALWNLINVYNRYFTITSYKLYVHGVGWVAVVM